MKMKLITTIFLHLATAAIVAAQGVDFSTLTPTNHKIAFPDGSTAAYKAYERIRCIDNAIDTNSQCISIFVPNDAKPDAPILLKTYTTDFRSATPQKPSPTDETGIALRNGIVVCIAGCRGHNSMQINTIEVQTNGKKKKKKKSSTETDVAYCGKLPAPLIDLKAAVRYLRVNDSKIPGSSEKIIASGYMAGGGLAALLGATADNPFFEPMLNEIGAAKSSDKIFAVACFAPLTDPSNASKSGEFLMENRGDYARQIDSLTLLIPESETPLLSKNYRKYLKDIMFESVREALTNHIIIDEDMGPDYYLDTRDPDDLSEYIVNFDIDRYIAALRPLAPKSGFKQYFNTLATKSYGDKSDKDYPLIIRQMNIATHLASPTPSTPKKWLIRHDAFDASVPITESITLYTMLSNSCINVDFQVQWYGKYDYSEIVKWILGL